MSKIMIVLIFIFSINIEADMLRIEGGGGLYNVSSSGSLGYNDIPLVTLDDLGFDSSNNFYLWMMLKHPIPILPNIRLEYTDIYMDSMENGAQTLNSFALTQYDMALFYNLLDNTFWMTLDLGIDLKYLKPSYRINPLLKEDSLSSDEIQVLLYLRSKVKIPITGLAVEGDIKGWSYDDVDLYDIRLKMIYSFESVPVVQPGIEIGYRIQKIDMKFGSLKTDVEFSGFFVGGVVRF